MIGDENGDCTIIPKKLGGSQMNRVRLGTVILAALLCLSFGTAWYVHRETDQLLQQLDQLEEIADTAPAEEAEAAFVDF